MPGLFIQQTPKDPLFIFRFSGNENFSFSIGVFRQLLPIATGALVESWKVLSTYSSD